MAADRLVVWYADWEMQCCGDPFAVGAEVDWPLEPVDTEWFDGAWPGLGSRLTHQEEHHQSDSSERDVHRLVVRAIAVARCVYGAVPGRDPRMHYPVPGSGTLQQSTIADGTEGDLDGARLAGYVVEVEVTASTESRNATWAAEDFSKTSPR